MLNLMRHLKYFEEYKNELQEDNNETADNHDQRENPEKKEIPRWVHIINSVNNQDRCPDKPAHFLSHVKYRQLQVVPRREQ